MNSKTSIQLTERESDYLCSKEKTINSFPGRTGYISEIEKAVERISARLTIEGSIYLILGKTRRYNINYLNMLKDEN